MNLFEIIDIAKDIIISMWDYIKKIFTKIVNFFYNIKNFFLDSNRRTKLANNRKTLAVSIKQNISDKNYRIVNCLYNSDNNTISDVEEDTLGIEAEDLDTETLEAFGDKDMIILT